MRAAFAADPEDYELNKRVGMLLASNPNTRHRAEPFLIKAVNENRDEPERLALLVAMAEVFEAAGAIEQENQVLQFAADMSPAYYKDLAFSWFRLGEIDKASDLFRHVIDGLYDLAKERADQRGDEVTQLIWPNNVICSRFGELAHTVDVYVKARKLGLTPKVKAILTTEDFRISNMALLEYWREQHADEITILTDPADVADAEKTFEDCGVCVDVYRVPGGRVLFIHQATPAIWGAWEEAGREPLLKLRDDHRERGIQWLRDRGVPEDAWFAALHVRESGYHGESGWAYNVHRDSRLEDYFPAVKAITERGGWVVRIGDPSMPPLPPMENVLDYAVATDRAPELDVFFCAAPRFMLGVTSGCIAVANVFGTPVLGVNMFPPGGYSYSGKDFYIHKLIRRRHDGKILDAAEMVVPPMRLMQSPQYFENNGFEVIPNTPDEIREATGEMMLRLDGEFQVTEQDLVNEAHYREMSDFPGVPNPPTPCALFLRRYPELLGR